MLAEGVLARNPTKTESTHEGYEAPIQVQHEATGGWIEPLFEIVVPLEQHPDRLLAWADRELYAGS